MGSRLQGRGRRASPRPDRQAAPHRRGSRLTRIAQVVPDVHSFAVDDGFAYSVPDDLAPVTVGSLVRVPLGGRRVRGFVTSVSERAADRPLKPIAAVSGDLPVFDAALLQTIRWASAHYVAPLASVLAHAAPPNLPKAPRRGARSPVPEPSGPQADWGRVQAAGGYTRPLAVVTGSGYAERVIDAVAPILRAGKNAMVAVPTAAEANGMSAALSSSFDDRVLLATAAVGAPKRTAAWSMSAGSGGFVVVGTREIVLWPAGELAGVVVVEEGRPAFKSPRTPTIHVRDVLRRRAAVERFGLLSLGPVPTTETIAAGVNFDRPPGRVWPLVEIVDRSEEAPGAGIVMERTRIAIGAVVRSGGRAFVLVPRRGYAPAFRCVRCRLLRRCSRCGAAANDRGPCRRCGAVPGACPACGATRFEPLGAGVGRVVDDLRRSFGDVVTAATDGGAILVGTERDLVGVSGLDLAVAIDADGAILAPHYRAEEDALRLLVRLALTVQRGRGKRCIVQTGDPSHPVIEALRSGTPFPFLDDVVIERAAAGFPPVGEIIAVEVVASHDDLPNAETSGRSDGLLREAAVDATVLGPAPGPRGVRWLIQGSDLQRTRILLREAVQTLRDGGERVRVDADPVDL